MNRFYIEKLKNSIFEKWEKVFLDQRNDRSDQSIVFWENVRSFFRSETYNENSIDDIFFEKLSKFQFSTEFDSSITLQECQELALPIFSHKLVFVNGKFVSSLSDQDIGNWNIDTEYDRRGVNRTFQPIRSDLFLDLTESLHSETIKIFLPNGKNSSKPLYLFHINVGKDNEKILPMIQYHHHIEIGSQSEGEIIEHFSNISDQPYFSSSRSILSIKDHARLKYTRLNVGNKKNFFFGNNDIILGNSSIVKNNFVSFGSSCTRDQTNIQLNGKKSIFSMNSLSFLSGRETVDIQSYLEHNKGHCSSRQLHKMVVFDQSFGMFNGLIKVKKKSIKTDSHMMNKNLLLHEKSIVQTRPQLEIYADNVKCNHGSTISSVDPQQVFYLCSRGIPVLHAKKMIIHAFASEIINRFHQDSLEKFILDGIDRTLETVKIL